MYQIDSYLSTSNKRTSTQQISKKLQLTKLIENYPGEYNISGQQLIDKYKKQLSSMQIDIVTERIINIYDMSDYFIIVSDKQQYQCDSVVLACGIPFGKTINGEKLYLGKGVSYCATCDGEFFTGKEVFVIGGGFAVMAYNNDVGMKNLKKKWNIY